MNKSVWLVYERDDLVRQWVGERIPGGVENFGPGYAIGAAIDDRLIAGFVFHKYSRLPTGGNIEISLASESHLWLRPSVIKILMSYPFGKLGCHRMTALVAAQNTKSRRFTEHFGFTLEGVIRQGFGTDDALVFGILRDEAQRWLGE